MSTKHLLPFFLSSGVLLGISWPHSGGLTFLVFFAFIPFLFAEHYIFTKRLRARKVFFNAYLMFVVFNAITTWWIYNASGGGMFMALFVNSFLMTLFVYLFHLVHRRFGNYYGYFSFIGLWMAYEYFHFHWELSWPWLNLGNVFANHTTWVQWYAYTGIGGGTLWILLVNVLVFSVLKNIYVRRENIKQNLAVASLSLTLILSPIIVSWIMFSSYEEKKDPADVVVVQPNIDPYGDKFGNMTGEEQLVIFLREAFLHSDSLVDLVVGPETALPYSIEENRITESGEIEMIQNAFSRLPQLAILTGMSSHRYYSKNENKPDNVRIYPDGTGVEFYNSALFVQNEKIDVYHKSQLVLGVEKIPFAKTLPFLEKFALDLGGTSGTLGIEKEPKIFTTKNGKIKAAPAVCYESIYGEYLSGFVNKGANLLVVITNDGWWDETAGYKQHFDYARLTAISLRRSIAQSANTGISGLINQRGEVLQHTEWWTRCAIRGKVNLNDELSFYAKHGDYLYRAGVFIFITALLGYLWAYFTGKNYVNKGEV